MRVASNSLQASLLVVESGSPASFQAYNSKEHPSVGPWSPTPALAHHSRFQCLAGMQGCGSIRHGHGGWLSGGVLGRAWEAEGPEPKTALCGPRRTRPDPERTLCVGSGRTGP